MLSVQLQLQTWARSCAWNCQWKWRRVSAPPKQSALHPQLSKNQEQLPIAAWCWIPVTKYGKHRMISTPDDWHPNILIVSTLNSFLPFTTLISSAVADSPRRSFKVLQTTNSATQRSVCCGIDGGPSRCAEMADPHNLHFFSYQLMILLVPSFFCTAADIFVLVCHSQEILPS